MGATTILFETSKHSILIGENIMLVFKIIIN